MAVPAEVVVLCEGQPAGRDLRLLERARSRELALPSVIGDPSIDVRNTYMRQECAGTLGLVIRARYVLDFARQRLLLYDR